MKKYIAWFLSAALAVQLASPAFAFDFFTTVDEDTYIGKEIAMEQQEGEVGVVNSAGRELSLRDGSGLYNGYEVYTAEGYVWVSLDNNGVLKMDMDTEIKIEKNGNDLEVVLIEGEVFFNISESFSDDETFTITTSTMTTGIRGTSGVVSTKKRADTGTEFQIQLFEGDVELNYLVSHATNQNYAVELSAGRTFWLATLDTGEIVYDEDGNVVYESHLSDLGEGDVDGFAAVEIKNSEALQEKILAAGGVIDETLLQKIIGTADGKLEADKEARKEFTKTLDGEKEEAHDTLLPLAQPEEEETEEETVTSTTDDATTTDTTTDDTTTDDTTVADTTTNDTTSADTTTDDSSSGDTTTDDTTEVTSITVTFYAIDNTTVFAEQSITSDTVPTKPYLQPSASGSWYLESNGDTSLYDFSEALTEDSSLYWVSIS